MHLKSCLYLVDDDQHVEEYEQDYENDPGWHNLEMDDVRGRYPRASLLNGPKHHYPSHSERSNPHREISTKALTKSSKLPRQHDPWEDDTYPEYSENQGFEDDMPPQATTYNKQEQRVSLI